MKMCPFLVSAYCKFDEWKEGYCESCDCNYAGDKSSLYPERKKYKKIIVQEGPDRNKKSR